MNPTGDDMEKLDQHISARTTIDLIRDGKNHIFSLNSAFTADTTGYPRVFGEAKGVLVKHCYFDEPGREEAFCSALDDIDPLLSSMGEDSLHIPQKEPVFNWVGVSDLQFYDTPQKNYDFNAVRKFLLPFLEPNTLIVLGESATSSRAQRWKQFGLRGTKDPGTRHLYHHASYAWPEGSWMAKKDFEK